MQPTHLVENDYVLVVVVVAPRKEKSKEGIIRRKAQLLSNINPAENIAISEG